MLLRFIAFRSNPRYRSAILKICSRSSKNWTIKLLKLQYFESQTIFNMYLAPHFPTIYSILRNNDFACCLSSISSKIYVEITVCFEDSLTNFQICLDGTKSKIKLISPWNSDRLMCVEFVYSTTFFKETV